MSNNTNLFKKQYKQHPIMQKAIAEFKNSSSSLAGKDVRNYMYQVMATIGLELENKFPDIVNFDDNRF